MKKPFTVAYDPLFDEWDDKSRPCIQDADGNRVPVRLCQNVGHPGEYDPLADKLAHIIARVLNEEDAL